MKKIIFLLILFSVISSNIFASEATKKLDKKQFDYYMEIYPELKDLLANIGITEANIIEFDAGYESLLSPIFITYRRSDGKKFEAGFQKNEETRKYELKSNQECLIYFY